MSRRQCPDAGRQLSDDAMFIANLAAGEDTNIVATQPIAERTGHYVSVEEYLSTSYEPDREYEDGSVVERNLGEFEH
jgi:hypothetical protein